MSLSPLHYAPPTEPWLAIMHEDRDMVVVDKPSGLLSVPGRTPELSDSVLSRVRRVHFHAQAVHRLDLGTSGVLVIAIRRKAEAALRQQFQDRQTRKVYLAMVHGRMESDTGTIDLPLICDWPNRPLQKVDFALGKPSVTRWRVLDYDAAMDATRVGLEPVTGRSHQLRVHMRELGHPMLGDPLYAPETIRGRSPRLLLHAVSLSMPHPLTGTACTFESPPPF